MAEIVPPQEMAPAPTQFFDKRFLRKLFRRTFSIRELGPFILLVIQVSYFANHDSGFYSSLNISNMLAFVPELGIIALGMTLLLTAGEFDLSVGSVFAMSQVTMFLLYSERSMDLEVGFAIAMLMSLGVGLTSGLLVTKLRISSFLITLGMMLVVRGGTLYFTDARSQTFGKTIESPLKEGLVGLIEVGDYKLYASLFWWLGLALVLHFILTQTAFGNWITATGGNPQAARARGTNTDNVKIILFMLTSLLAGFAGCISALRLSTAYPISGDGYELEVIAMVVIGGTLLQGGRGSIIGSLIGALILRTMRNGIIFVGIPGLAYQIFIGAIIIFMAIFHSILERTAHLGDR